MANERLRSAMAKAGKDIANLADATAVDPKTVQRWLAGRVPHPRHRWVIASLVDEDEGHLWPSARPDLSSGAEATPEIISAYAHRVDVPRTKWSELLATSRRHVDILGYSFLFFPEQHINLAKVIEKNCASGCRVRTVTAFIWLYLLLRALTNPKDRVMRADLADELTPGMSPEKQRTRLRNRLSNMLNGTLPARIHMTLCHLKPLESVPGVEVRHHDVHLYNAIYRFDDQMIVTPYLYRAHGFQHPALHIRRLGPYGLFANFLEQFDHIWEEARRPSQDVLFSRREAWR